MLYLGGDVDPAGQPVPDYVTIRYNTILHRYEIGALVWDAANQQFVTTDTPAVLQAAEPDLDGTLSAELSFGLQRRGQPIVPVTVRESARRND